MRLVCRISELMEALGLSDVEMQQQVGIDRRTIEKLRRDAPDWRLSREMLQRLMVFAFEHGYRDGIFQVRPHPLWQTFHSATPLIIRSGEERDAEVEAHLRAFLRNLGAGSELMVWENVPEPDLEILRSLMRTKNCIFVGSPKASHASEIALATLFGVEPFQRPQESAVLRFLGMRRRNLFEESAFLVDDDPHGIEASSPDHAERRFAAVDWRPPEEYAAFSGEGQDAAAVVVCRRPLGIEVDVTTVVIAGYTGLATLLAARQLTHGEPTIDERRLEGGSSPQVALFRYRFKKRPTPASGGLADLRREIEGSEQWVPLGLGLSEKD